MKAFNNGFDIFFVINIIYTAWISYTCFKIHKIVYIAAFLFFL